MSNPYKVSMKPEIKAQWVTALKSGKYTQAKGALRTPEGHCCLGVLCEILPEFRIEDSEDGHGDEVHIKEGHTNNVVWSDGSMTLIDRVVEEAGITVMPGYMVSTLAVMNDSGNYSFEQIADWIEENL
jgi:hypothetical protein